MQGLISNGALKSGKKKINTRELSQSSFKDLSNFYRGKSKIKSFCSKMYFTIKMTFIHSLTILSSIYLYCTRVVDEIIQISDLPR